MRLVIDARLIDNSGIGVYLSRVLPRVAERCASHRPLVLAATAKVDRVRALAGPAAECRAWDLPPLSAREILPPPVGGRDILWWAPHYNVPLLATSPMVVTLHDVLPLSEAGRDWPAAKRLGVRAWLAAIRSRAVRILCSSGYTRDEVARLAGIDPARMQVVRLGVDTPATAPSLAEQIASGPYLLFVGLIKRHKNLLGLLRAFESISATIPHRLVVVGRHSVLRDVDTEALDLARRLAPRVELIDSVPYARLVQLMAGADLLVQPSYYEGFGLPPLEAMALGTPVASSRAASLPETCGDAAVYFDPGSTEEMARTIREVLGDAVLRATLRARGLERAREFTWQRCADATSDALLQALGGPAR